ncbi:MAG TPA: phage integrase N-terminal SAM-like domain-containing protein [Gammaproteobacteria bacterium]
MAASPFLTKIRQAIQVRHYSIRTGQSYITWIKQFIHFHGNRHPDTLGEKEIEQFLTHLACERNVTPSTQNVALNAILFMYRQVLDRELEKLSFNRASKPARLPVVLTTDEVVRVLNNLEGNAWLMANLLYGAGLRLTECVSLRIKDLDFDHRAVIVRSGNGDKNHHEDSQTRQLPYPAHYAEYLIMPISA